MYKVGPITVALVAGLALAQVRAQEPIPEASLKANLDECLTECRANNAEQVCQTLCGCTIDRFRQNLNLADYLKLLTEMKSGELSPSVQSFLNETGRICGAMVPE